LDGLHAAIIAISISPVVILVPWRIPVLHHGVDRHHTSTAKRWSPAIDIDAM